MATFQWFNGNGGIWNYQNTTLFSPTTMTTSQLIGTYNGNDGPFDPYLHAWTSEATLNGASLYTYRVGPNAGTQVYNAGTITGLSFFDQSHSLLLSVTGLSIDLPSFATLANQGLNLWDVITRGSNVYLGSNNSLSNGWDGDDIHTGSGDDLVMAYQGNDFITDGGGADVYRGGQGYDQLNYGDWKWLGGQMVSGIQANLALGMIVGPDGKVDQVFSIDDVRGTQLGDVVFGNASDNWFEGLQGNDTLRGGLGYDIVSYAMDAYYGGTDGVRVNLANLVARDGFGTFDSLKNIEGARGTAQDDVFFDDAGDNWFDGRDGNDVFTLRGGNDFVIGGAGADNFQFLGGAFGDDIVDDFNRAEGDIITIQGAGSFSNFVTSIGGGVETISWNGTSITFNNQSSPLTASDFVFV